MKKMGYSHDTEYELTRMSADNNSDMVSLTLAYGKKKKSPSSSKNGILMGFDNRETSHIHVKKELAATLAIGDMVEMHVSKAKK